MTDAPKPGLTPPVYANAHSAPFVYFDNVLTFGTMWGAIEIELSSRVIIPGPEKTSAETVCTGHLRCSAVAAAALRDVIDRALAMLPPVAPSATPEPPPTTPQTIN